MKKNIICSLLLVISIKSYGDCKIKEATSELGGYKELTVGEKNKLSDVDSFKTLDEKVFYAISPVYGKPEIGVIDCSNEKRTKIVSPKNFHKAYPNGTDFFRIKDVVKDKARNRYLIRYYYAADVDKQDFKNFENQKNLKSVTFTK